MNGFRLVLTSLAFASLALELPAQIELPEGKIDPPKESKPAVVPEPPRGDLAEKSKPKAAAPRSQSPLDLPSERAPKPAPPAAPEKPREPTAAPAVPTGSNTAADFVLEELGKVGELDSPLIDHAAQSLLRMGDLGRAAAARGLGSEHTPTLLAAAKTLLQSGVAADCEIVQQRLRNKLPATAGAALVDTLCALDPVHASPEFLGELLAHRQGAVRTAAQRHLARLGSALPLAALKTALAAKDSDSRLRAVHLAALSKDPEALTLLLERSSDANPAVARRAVEALAASDDARVEDELLRRAFAGNWVLRGGAYALLALCEREDARVTPLIGAAHVERLLEGLQANDGFVAGTCAAALAGIGFRSSDLEATRWIDLEVPHRLVRIVSADEFAADSSSLVPTAVRRLALLAGENFGADGPAWIEWWSAHAGEFHACRATLPATIEASGELEVAATTASGSTSWLLGPARAERAVELRGETLFLSEAQTRALFEVLRVAGVFTAERLPGSRGSVFEPGRSLSVTIAGRTKAFRFPGASAEPWFDTAFEAARALAERNRWQRFADGKRYASQLELWRAEAPWWDETTSERDRARREWELVLAWLENTAVASRDGGIAELARLAKHEGLVRGDDFRALAARLREERFVGPRARALLALAIGAGTRTEGAGPVLGVPFADELVRSLIETFELDAASELGSVLAAAGREYARRCAADPRPLVRAVSAATLARGSDAADLEALRTLLGDPDSNVVAAAVLALGENKVEPARGAVLERSRGGDPIVRAAALRALGLLGGEDVLSSLLAALADRDPSIAAAGAEGLALLNDPGTAQVLASLLARGPEHPCYPAARRGLLHLGERAWDELLRSVRSNSAASRREAALLLSEQLVPQVASVLMTLLTESPGDTRVAEELAVLTCSDFRGDADPAGSWWRWWEYVVHDDAQAWLAAALGRLGVVAPAPEDLRAGSDEALAFLSALVMREEPALCERGRREFARLAGRDPGSLPSRGGERAAWAKSLVEALQARAKH
jgi:HEAT repeat protein